MIEILTGTLILLGSVFILLSSIGLIKMPDLYTRMSATTKASTLGVSLILIGTALYFGNIGVASRAFLIIVFLLITVPIAAHMIARAAYFDGVPLWNKTWMDDLKGKYNKQTHELEGQNSNLDETRESNLE